MLSTDFRLLQGHVNPTLCRHLACFLRAMGPLLLSFASKEEVRGTDRPAFTCQLMWPSQARAPAVSWGGWDSPKTWLAPWLGPQMAAPPPLLYLRSDRAWVQALGDSFLLRKL